MDENGDLFLVLTRNQVLEVRSLVTVAEVTSTMRGLAAEVPFHHELAGLDEESAINCGGIHTVPPVNAHQTRRCN